MHNTEYENNILKGIVYAGGDGILTTLAIVSGAYGGNLSSGIVLMIGISNCVADALNMGLGDLISGITEAQHFVREKKIFEDEVTRHPEDEMDNLRQIFVEKGMSIPDAHRLSGFDCVKSRSFHQSLDESRTWTLSK